MTRSCRGQSRLLVLLVVLAAAGGGLLLVRGRLAPPREDRPSAPANSPAEQARLAAERVQMDEEREKELRREIQSGKAEARAFVELASLQMQRGSPDALATLQEGTQRHPASVSLWMNLGMLYRQGGRLEEALAALRAANRTDPENVLVAATLANFYSDLGWLREARATLRPAVAARPDDASVRMSLSRIEAQSGNFRAARVHAEKVTRLPYPPTESYVLLGQAWAGQGNHERAAASFQRALGADPSLVDARVQLAEEQMEQGTKASRDRAVETLEEGLKLQPDHPGLKRALGFALLGRGSRKEALEILLPMAEDEQADDVLLSAVARAVRAAGRGSEAGAFEARARNLREAADRLDRLIARCNNQPGDTSALLELASAYRERSDFQRARLELTRLLEANPGHAPARAMLERLPAAPPARHTASG